MPGLPLVTPRSAVMAGLDPAIPPDVLHSATSRVFASASSPAGRGGWRHPELGGRVKPGHDVEREVNQSGSDR